MASTATQPTPAEMALLGQERGYWQIAKHFPQGHFDLLGNEEIFAAPIEELPDCDLELPSLTHHTLSIPFDIDVRKTVRIDGLRYSGRLQRGDVSVVPAGLPANIRWQGRYRRAMQIFIADTFVERLLAREELQGLSSADFVPTILFQNDLLTDLSRCLRTELLDKRPGGKMLAESLAHAMILGALRACHGSAGRREVGTRSTGHSLAPHKLRRIIDYMYANLAEDITLSDLAAIAECSLDHLKHAFRDQTGEPPYRHLLRLRIDKARHLMIETDETLDSVARHCGFSSQAHFTTAFARIVGETPARWRRAQA